MSRFRKVNSLLFLFLLFPFLTSASKPNYETKFFNDEKLNLNDLTKEEIDQYYKDVDFSLDGNNLKNSLNYTISKNNHFLDYGSGSNQGVGKWYKITDRNYSISDPINVDTYKFSEDKNYFLVNCYFENSANNDVTKAINNRVNSFTKDESLISIDWVNEKTPNKTIQVDKEHIWAKNHGFKNVVNGSDTFPPGASTDLHHLIAADHNSNSSGHNDYYYGNVPSKDEAEKIYCYYADGTTAISGWLYKGATREENIFEPTDEWKGNIARALFYMATRYGILKTGVDEQSQSEPYLLFSDDIKEEDLRQQYNPWIGVHKNLNVLLDWNIKDPVDDYEIHRNNLIYNNVQNNRNPYIDYYKLDDNKYLANQVFNDNYGFDSNEGNNVPSENNETPSIPFYVYIIIGVAAVVVITFAISFIIVSNKKHKSRSKNRK